MSSISTLYKKISLPAVHTVDQSFPKRYKGFSTINSEAENFNLYDFELIKQDLLNHFYTRQGERLMNPTFGTIIWDLLFEPLTESVKNLILQNVNEIINYDPRIVAEDVVVTSYESGIQIECRLKYSTYNMTQMIQLKFDQANGLLIQ
jgi:phage baseplate assembly protein W